MYRLANVLLIVMVLPTEVISRAVHVQYTLLVWAVSYRTTLHVTQVFYLMTALMVALKQVPLVQVGFWYVVQRALI